jgi:hypothetical protein
MFNKVGANICDACRQREEADFDLCYHYLRDNPNSSVAVVSDATGVAERQIMEFYRNGRLLAGEAGYPCERCGGPTHRGSYCAKCTENLRSGFAPSTPAPKGTPTPPDPDDGRERARRDFSHQLRIDRR